MPITERHPLDASLLLAQARPLLAIAGLSVLAPADMILHSMTHVFYNDDLSHGLRDLSDLDLLLRHHGAEAGFWPPLLDRGKRLAIPS